MDLGPDPREGEMAQGPFAGFPGDQGASNTSRTFLVSDSMVKGF